MQCDLSLTLPPTLFLLKSLNAWQQINKSRVYGVYLQGVFSSCHHLHSSNHQWSSLPVILCTLQRKLSSIMRSHDSPENSLSFTGRRKSSNEYPMYCRYSSYVHRSIERGCIRSHAVTAPCRAPDPLCAIWRPISFCAVDAPAVAARARTPSCASQYPRLGNAQVHVFPDNSTCRDLALKRTIRIEYE